MTHAGSAQETTTGAGLTTLEHRLIYDLAQEKGWKVSAVAVLYGVKFDEATGRLYRRAQDNRE